MTKKIGIIGAGISGLSAGCYLQMNGYDTEIFEMHSLAGGLCTAWKRKGYTMDNCIHWLVGSSPENPFYGLWCELIDMKKLNFYNYHEYIRVEDERGGCIIVYTDLDKLARELLDKAPEDKDLINDFISGTKKLLSLELPVTKARELYTFGDGLKMMAKIFPYLGTLKKWSKISLADFGNRCKTPLLKKMFVNAFVPEMAVIFFMFTLAWMHRQGAGYPIGGSLFFAGLIEKRYKELGGKIHFQSKVKKIITENDSARGLILENGSSHSFDVVISAADGHATIFDMLEGRYIDKKIDHFYRNYQTFSSYFLLSLGIARSFENMPHAVLFPLTKPLKLSEGDEINDFSIFIYNYDPSLAPQGKTVINSIIPTYQYKYWVDLREKDKEKYKFEKERIIGEAIDILEKRLGGIKAKVEVADLSTPATVIRYTNNWKGSFEGWIMTPQMGLRQMKKELPGLKNFYMIGQWVEPGGGLPPALMSGRNVAQISCHRDKKKFMTTKAV